MPIYLNLRIVRGESTADGYEGWIELDTFSIDPSGARRDLDGSTKATEISCTKQLNSTSVLLRQLSDTKKPSQQVNVDFVNRKGFAYLKMRLFDVIIAFHSFSNADNGPPAESFSLFAARWEKEFFNANYSGVARDKPKEMGWELLK
jgi:type VI protein secretion system component Hcp